MRLLRILLALACLAAGVVVGALNTQLVRLDLGLVELTPSLGVALIVALLLGVLVGGLALAASVVWPLRRRLARAERGAAVAPTPDADTGA
jgi:lipopolysaccharide assembly protein A